MSLRKANEIDAAYRQKRREFERQHELLLKLFKGTPLVKDMEALKDAVDDAYAFNVQAGWVSEYDSFDRLEYVVSVIKQDYRGRLVRSKVDIPSDLLDEFDDLDEVGFVSYMGDLRYECRCAYGEIRELRSGLKHSLSSTTFIDELHCLAEESSVSASEMPGLQALFDNIDELWNGYERLAKSLLHMANELGDSDYDPSLMEALLFD